MQFFEKLLARLASSGPAYQYQSLHSGIEILNFWPGQAPEDLWLHRFFQNRLQDVDLSDQRLTIASLFGPRNHIRQSPGKTKIFFSGENLDRFPKYKDYCIDEVDLAMGFDYLQHPKYLRLPLWLLYLLDPVPMRQADIQKRLDNIMAKIRANYKADKRFCSLISSHDKNGIRSRLLDAVSTIEKVDSAGKFRNNTNLLKEQYQDDKPVFLAAYRFNICPENTNKAGYVTEKLFEVILAGAVPIYWGSNNRPEPEVLNQDAILYYNGRRKINTLLKEISDLHHNEHAYREFSLQDRFAPHAAEYIAETLNTLEQSVRKLIATK